MHANVALQPRLTANSPVRQAMRSLGDDRVSELALRAAARRALWRKRLSDYVAGSELEPLGEVERLADPVVGVRRRED